MSKKHKNGSLLHIGFNVHLCPDYNTNQALFGWALGGMDSDFNVIMPEGNVQYVVYKGMKLYIKNGRNTSMRVVK